MSPVQFLIIFSFTQESVEAKSLAFAQHIINSIEAGKIPVNTALPALKVLKKNNNCSTSIPFILSSSYSLTAWQQIILFFSLSGLLLLTASGCMIAVL
jgi:hypothetical protein